MDEAMTGRGKMAGRGNGIRRGEVEDRKLTVSLPEAVLRQLKARMAAEDKTIRALVLEALTQAGYEVPAAEIRDRRRSA